MSNLAVLRTSEEKQTCTDKLHIFLLSERNFYIFISPHCCAILRISEEKQTCTDKLHILLFSEPNCYTFISPHCWVYGFKMRGSVHFATIS